ncbi:hypothetical protein QTP88_021389 [Uroleucon formosanum]
MNAAVECQYGFKGKLWTNIMSTITAVESSPDVEIQLAKETMIQTFEELRENRPKLLEEGDLTSLKLHKRYHSLPNMSLQSISAGEALQKTAALMAQVFSYLRENRLIPVKGNDIKSLQAHRRYKSMPNMVLICVCHAPEAIPSVASTKIQVFADIPAAESTKSGIMTPVAVEASSIGSLLPVSSTLSPVQPVDSDGQQLSSMPNVGIQLIGLSELKNSLPNRWNTRRPVAYRT